MPTIYLAQDFACHYSDEDADAVGAHRWMLHRTARNGRYYAYAFIRVFDPAEGRVRRRKLYMHRMIAKPPASLIVDHADRDGLNNRRWNLRVTTETFNNANADRGENLCGYRGVSRDGRGYNRYRARIQFDGEETRIGVFGSAMEAALAYDGAARRLFGAFAWCNFNPEMDALREREAAAEAQRAEDLELMPF